MGSEQQAGVPSRLTLDVLNLAKLQGLDVPPTNDSLKYEYRVENRRYGTLPPAQVTQPSLFLVYNCSVPQCSQNAERRSWPCMTVRTWFQRSVRVSPVESFWTGPVSTRSRGVSHLTGATSPATVCRSADSAHRKCMMGEKSCPRNCRALLSSRMFCFLWRLWTGQVAMWSIR